MYIADHAHCTRHVILLPIVILPGVYLSLKALELNWTISIMGTFGSYVVTCMRYICVRPLISMR